MKTHWYSRMVGARAVTHANSVALEYIIRAVLDIHVRKAILFPSVNFSRQHQGFFVTMF